MNKLRYCIINCFLLLLFALNIKLSAKNVNAPILVISSYNPDAKYLSSYISGFIEQYRKMKPDQKIIVNSMNCKTLSDAGLWIKDMRNILIRCKRIKPAMIVLLGQEAWTSYLSQKTDVLSNIPVIGSKASRYIVTYPKGKRDVFADSLTSTDIMKLTKKYNLVGGIINNYDIQKSIQLVQHFYPSNKNIYFITDNSCGGACLNAQISKEIKNIKNIHCNVLDGRKLSYLELMDNIAKLPKKSALILGTWRVDKENSYYVNASLYQLRDINPNIPTFSLTGKELGFWAIGGYTPIYDDYGVNLANCVYHYLHKKNTIPIFKFTRNHYLFNNTAIISHKLQNISLPPNSKIINPTISIWVGHKHLFIGIIIAFVIICTGLICVTILFIRTHRLKNELKLSHASLLLTKEAAEKASAMKTNFIKNISHEIRTPLNVIIGFSGLIGSDLTDKKRKEYGNIIQENSSILLNIINNVLDISSLTTEKEFLFFQQVDIIKLCKNVIKEIQEQTSRPLKISFDTPFEKKIEIIDCVRTKQILYNLLSNAQKFTNKGNVILRFNVNDTEKKLFFSIEDTGCGIPEDKQQKVFDAFEKVDNFIPGAGLGLSICKLIIESWGGKIWFDKNYKIGTKILFYLPMQEELSTNKKITTNPYYSTLQQNTKRFV